MRTLRLCLASFVLLACGDDSATSTGGSTSTGGAATTGGAGGEASSTTTGGAGGESSASGGMGGEVSTNTGGGSGCTPGAVEACYEGPPDTVDNAPCAGGQRTCLGDGTFGPCEGQVLPSTDLCSTSDDEDCTGAANEGCLCEPGTQVACYSGPPGTQGVGACATGLALCDASGERIGPCVGDVLPGTQTCALPAIDTDCDGTANMGCCVSGEWTFEDLASGPANTLLENSIAVDAAGNVWIVYRESLAMHIVHRAPGGTLSTYQPVMSHYSSDIAVDALGNVHVAYVAGSSLYHAVKGPNDSTFTITEVTSSGGVGDTTLAVSPSGDVHIVLRTTSLSYHRKLAGSAMFEQMQWKNNVLSGSQVAELDPQGNLHVGFTEKLFAQSSLHNVSELFVPAGSLSFAEDAFDTNATGGKLGFDVDPLGGLHASYGDSFATDVVHAVKPVGAPMWTTTDCIACGGPIQSDVVGQASGATDVVYSVANGAQRTLHHNRFGAGATSAQLTTNTGFHSLAGDSAGGLHLAYVDKTAQPMTTLRYGYRCP